MKDLDSFLKEQEDGLFDSTGAFTISADKALEKLATSQLPDSAYWVLKVAQFATLRGVSELTFKMDRRLTRVTMNLPEPLALAHIQKGLGDPTPLEDPALENLVTALRSLGANDKRRFGLLLGSPEGGDILTWDSEKLGVTSNTQAYSAHPFVLEVAAGSRRKFTSLLFNEASHRRAEELKLLRNQAFTVPFRLFADGAELNSDSLHSSLNFSVPVILDYSEDNGEFQLPPVGLQMLQKTLPSAYRDQRIQRVKSIPLKVSAFWQISFQYNLSQKPFSVNATVTPTPGKHRLNWIREGVIIETVYLGGTSTPFSLDIFVDCSTCPSDLGGLRLRQSAELTEKLRFTRDLIAEIRERAEREIPTLELPEGYSQGGWSFFRTGLTYMPLDGTVKYRNSDLPARLLNNSPSVRKQTLKEIKKVLLRSRLFWGLKLGLS